MNLVRHDAVAASGQLDAGKDRHCVAARLTALQTSGKRVHTVLGGRDQFLMGTGTRVFFREGNMRLFGNLIGRIW